MTNWTDNEIATLKKEYQRGASYPQIIKALGTPRNVGQIRGKVEHLGLLRKHEKLTENKRVGHLDIETSQLNASFGFMISWAIKDDGKKTILSDNLSAEDFSVEDKLNTDRRVVLSMVEALDQFDVITTFFGEYFDIPFIRSRCLFHGKEFLPYGSVNHVDVWKIARKNMKLHSHRLEVVAEYLKVNSKTKLRPNTWARGVMGDQTAIREIVKHNREDVITLEKVYHLLKPYWAGTKKSI